MDRIELLGKNVGQAALSGRAAPEDSVDVLEGDAHAQVASGDSIRERPDEVPADRDDE